MEHMMTRQPGPRLGALRSGWTLGPGLASTMKTHRAGVLRVSQGRLWLTFTHARHDLGVRAGDYFLNCGESLALGAGEVVVMESYGLRHAPAVALAWAPVPNPLFALPRNLPGAKSLKHLLRSPT
ncbi:MAG: DUF2917 domain-containing protein [Polaromonas sp.]|uniref:DUF2917 domain-containing protein n=1 Tax=Polaromonas sp. TaxID=1869339 RepID=UPI0017C8DC25|nr:DUF2917 domain-containing protein [Polaromonas sp.]NMM11651.1 DUF2917 domain-containing protein [Polaromonas sp.]